MDVCGVFKGRGVCMSVSKECCVSVCVRGLRNSTPGLERTRQICAILKQSIAIRGVDKVISAQRTACQVEEVQTSVGKRREKP